MANYYDILDILMQDENVSTVFLHKANGAGFLDPSSEDNNVARGSVVDLPLWLAQDLVQRQIVHVKLPGCFNERVRKEVQADPACIDLRSKCPFYYEMGCKLVELNVDNKLGPFLLKTLQGRYKDLLCKALTATLTGNPKFVPLLTEEETRYVKATTFDHLGSRGLSRHEANLLMKFEDVPLPHEALVLKEQQYSEGKETVMQLRYGVEQSLLAHISFFSSRFIMNKV